MDDCIGLYYRASCSTYRTKNGIARKVELRLLKRRSCLGCDHCAWVLEEFGECEEGACHVVFNHVEHGKIYRPEIKILSTDFESGWADDWEILMKKVSP